MVKETQLYKVAEVQVSYKPDYDIKERPKLNSPYECYELLKQQWDMGKIHMLEEFKVILLNRSNRVLGIVSISSGGVSGTLVDPKIIFSAALKANASSIILVHNHPSGSLMPSESDLKLTKRLVDGGKLLEIIVWDHLIISENAYYSFADDGII